MTKVSTKETLVIGISSRALFNLDESHSIFEAKGADVYSKHQIENEDTPLSPGVAFNLVKKLLAINTAENKLIEVVLISRNSADTGLRVFKSIEHHQLNISRAAFTQGESPFNYVKNFKAHLFLSANQDDVRAALTSGIAAATILSSSKNAMAQNQLRIAFDGDAVLFSDEAEQIFNQHGLDAFNQNEVESRANPLSGGPFKAFLAALHEIQTLFSAEHSPIRTALVTARGAPAHERVIRTLRSWNIRIDEVLFLGGLPKGPFLESFGADIFFDDQHKNCEGASGFVPTGHVPYGIKNNKV